MAELTEVSVRFLLTPLREGRPRRFPAARQRTHFYSRPCGRGDSSDGFENVNTNGFLLTPLREGRRPQRRRRTLQRSFLLTPLREGRQGARQGKRPTGQFLLTPLREGRQAQAARKPAAVVFLLTPLREGRLCKQAVHNQRTEISTHAPAGGATKSSGARLASASDFYSRPCGRGDASNVMPPRLWSISTHAPAGGATCFIRCPGRPSRFLLTPLREGRQYGLFYGFLCLS